MNQYIPRFVGVYLSHASKFIEYNKNKLDTNEIEEIKELAK